MASRGLSQVERLTALEVQVTTLQEDFKALAETSEKRHKGMDDKLDQLLSLRDKGLGVFWLASTLTGVGILGFIGQVFDWWKGLLNG